MTTDITESINVPSVKYEIRVCIFKLYFFQFFFNSLFKKLIVWGVDDANLNDIVPDTIYQKTLKLNK